MANYSWRKKLRHLWNWLRGKRIICTDPQRGRVKIRTGHNSANRNNGGQWYIQRYEVANGPPPLPLCSRGRLDNPKTIFQVQRYTGEELVMAKLWYKAKHGELPEGQELELVCVFERNQKIPGARVMHYRPDEIFEIEYPWLSTDYSGPAFDCYFGTWYGQGMLGPGDIMDFEIFWRVAPASKPLPKWGASWR